MSKVIMVVFCGMFLLFLSYFGGKIEGRFFPVTGATVLTSVQPDGETRSLIWGRALRQRDCSFVRLEWRIGTQEHYKVVDLVVLKASKLRRDGVFRFGPWRLHATPQQIEDRSFATVVHRCHLFWETETLFYVAPGATAQPRTK